MHRTGAALPVITTFLRSGESDGLTDAIEQRCPRVDPELAILAVNAQRDRNRALDVWLVRHGRGGAARLGSCVRLRRSAPRYDCCCRRTSRSPKKYPAVRIWARW